MRTRLRVYGREKAQTHRNLTTTLMFVSPTVIRLGPGTLSVDPIFTLLEGMIDVLPDLSGTIEDMDVTLAMVGRAAVGLRDMMSGYNVEDRN